MNYLLPSEYAAYGLSAETADAWVAAASAMMDAYCRRPTLAAQSYVERLRVGRSSHAVLLSYGPLVSVQSVRAKFAHGGGFSEGSSVFGDDVAAAFCAPGSWAVVDVATVDLDATLGELTLPRNVLGAAYVEAEVSYTAGFSEVPVAVKVACAQVVKNAQATPALNVRSNKMDTLQMEYFSDSLFDVQVRALLQPYLAERMC